MEGVTIRPIAYIKSDFTQKFGIPRQSGRASSLRARVVFLPEYRNKEALREIDSFSHLWLIFDFSLAHREGWSPTVRPPRLGGNKRVGVFASRSPFRPNNLGLSCVELISIEEDKNDGYVLVIGGADLLDGTPVYDIKPYLPDADSKPEARGGYSEKEWGYRLEVEADDELLKILPHEKVAPLLECLADDPRPSYKEEDDRIYVMSFAGFEISFVVNEGKLRVTDIKKG